MMIFDYKTKDLVDFEIPRDKPENVGLICDILVVDPNNCFVGLLMMVGAFMKICYLHVDTK